MPRDLRYRRSLFPGSDSLVFSTSEKGFIPVPIILRKLLRHLSAAEFRVLLYLQLRASRYGICYPTIEEIVHELGLTSRKNLMPHIHSLEDKRFISTKMNAGRTFFLIHDPRVPIGYLHAAGLLGESDLAEINELYADLGQRPITVPPEDAVPVA